jgi:hypothetical protein
MTGKGLFRRALFGAAASIAFASGAPAHAGMLFSDTLREWDLTPGPVAYAACHRATPAFPYERFLLVHARHGRGWAVISSPGPAWNSFMSWYERRPDGSYEYGSTTQGQMREFGSQVERSLKRAPKHRLAVFDNFKTWSEAMREADRRRC